MPIIGLTADGKKIALAAASGPSSYPSGGFSVTVKELNHVHAVLYASITGGYKIGALTVSGNAVTVVVHQYNYPATSAGPSTEVSSGTDLSGQTVTIIAIGD
ncbi:MAG: hypothetical protein QXH03_11355 [Candidatus Bathyarchaeia archaeon]